MIVISILKKDGRAGEIKAERLEIDDTLEILYFLTDGEKEIGCELDTDAISKIIITAA